MLCAQLTVFSLPLPPLTDLWQLLSCTQITCLWQTACGHNNNHPLSGANAEASIHYLLRVTAGTSPSWQWGTPWTESSWCYTMSDSDPADCSLHQFLWNMTICLLPELNLNHSGGRSGHVYLIITDCGSVLSFRYDSLWCRLGIHTSLSV